MVSALVERPFVGSYELQRPLGSGGMAQLYLGRHRGNGSLAAIKILHEDLASDRTLRRRFSKEARAIASIRHPNVVRLYEYGATEDGNAYLAIEYVAGEELETRLKIEKTLPVPHALGLADQIAGALSAVHAVGIAHRDLKPNNIMLVHGAPGAIPEAKVLDFGIAKFFHSADVEESCLTLAGVIVGTPKYMAPEQCLGRRNVDHRADIYSLGVILYRMVAGRAPFCGRGPGEIIAMQIHREPVPPSTYCPHLPPGLEAIIMRCLSKSPDARYQSMAELSRDLRMQMAGLHRYSSGPVQTVKPTQPQLTIPRRPGKVAPGIARSHSAPSPKASYGNFSATAPTQVQKTVVVGAGAVQSQSHQSGPQPNIVHIRAETCDSARAAYDSGKLERLGRRKTIAVEPSEPRRRSGRIYWAVALVALAGFAFGFSRYDLLIEFESRWQALRPSAAPSHGETWSAPDSSRPVLFSLPDNNDEQTKPEPEFKLEPEPEPEPEIETKPELQVEVAAAPAMKPAPEIAPEEPKPAQLDDAHRARKPAKKTRRSKRASRRRDRRKSRALRASSEVATRRSRPASQSRQPSEEETRSTKQKVPTIREPEHDSEDFEKPVF